MAGLTLDQIERIAIEAAIHTAQGSLPAPPPARWGSAHPPFIANANAGPIRA
jgi:hypothetical protein